MELLDHLGTLFQDQSAACNKVFGESSQTVDDLSKEATPLRDIEDHIEAIEAEIAG